MAMVVPLCRPSLYRQELAFKSFQADYNDSFQRPRTVIFASATEPKWKQKLAAADEHQERTRQATAQAQEEYRRKQDALRRQQSQGAGEIPSLKDLEYYSYLTEEGLIADCTRPDAKASVYAIFDQNKTLCYIGVSRQVYQSMRLHFARRPLECYYVKVHHVTRPSRALLESTREKWVSENGSIPSGNDNGEVQNIWENALDCTPLMTEEEKILYEDAATGPPKAKVLKNVARRIEKDLEALFKERNCSDKLRFDPKLKDKCLLDLKTV
ncbi:hypothetical protein CY35_09G001100 [Sphagnum magellanicum]|jgi:hypothetical protein|nr:hypothetical protein CY35_09G001100 [Sphagnum magellanicum]